MSIFADIATVRFGISALNRD